MSEFFHFVTDPSKGVTVVSNHAIPAGHTILVEEPLIRIAETPIDHIDELDRFCESRQLAPQLLYLLDAFFKAEDGVQERVLKLYCPPLERVTRLEPLIQALPKLQRFAAHSPRFLAELIARYDINCIQVNETSGDTAVYEMACRFCHSCAPNCFWFSSPTGQRHIRTIVGVPKDTELTVSYLSGEWLLLPTHARRMQLAKTKLFLCECSRKKIGRWRNPLWMTSYPLNV